MPHVSKNTAHVIVLLLCACFCRLCPCCCLPVSSLFTGDTPSLCCFLPCFSTEWSCNCTEMRPTKFQRSNDNENDHKCLFTYWQARGNNSSGFVWRSQGVEIRLLDLNPVRIKDEPPLMSAHDKSFLYSGYESHPQWSEICLSKR